MSYRRQKLISSETEEDQEESNEEMLGFSLFDDDVTSPIPPPLSLSTFAVNSDHFKIPVGDKRPSSASRPAASCDRSRNHLTET